MTDFWMPESKHHIPHPLQQQYLLYYWTPLALISISWLSPNTQKQNNDQNILAPSL